MLQNTFIFTAGADCTGFLGHPVVLASDGTVSPLSADMTASTDVIGILENEPAEGGDAEVSLFGTITRAYVSAAVTKGQIANAAGADGLSHADTAVKTIGRFLEDGAAGDLVRILVTVA